MKFLNDRAYASLVSRLETAEAKVAEYVKKETDTGIYTDVIDSTRNACPPVFDFKNEMFVIYSVERVNQGTKAERTDIAYFLLSDPNKKMSTWTFYCSRKQHNDVVEAYKESLKPVI